ncbi:MAG: queuosine precursor transporter [Patescibacteria group bacterium]
MPKIKRFDLLIAIYIFCVIASELMGAKTFPLFQIFGLKLNASVAIFVIPIIYLVNDIIVEVHGKERARSIVWSSLFVVALLVGFSILATILPPSARFAGSERAYDDIFTKSIRISLASLMAFAFAEFLDIFIFSKLREKLGQKSLWLRTNASNIIAQFFDTSIFMILAFYTIGKPFGDNLGFLLGLILPYWLLKSLMSILETPFVYLGVNWLKKEKKW